MSSIARTRFALLARRLRNTRGLSTAPEPRKTRLAQLGESAVTVAFITLGISVSNWYMGAPSQADVKALSADLEALNERVEKLMQKADMGASEQTRH